MPESVRQAEQVDDDVGDVAVVVIDYQVQVDVVAGAKAAACQGARDGNAPDERRDSDQIADEVQRELDVPAGLRLVGPRPGADLPRHVKRRAVDHKVVGDGELRTGRDRPADVTLRNLASEAELRQA